MAVPDFQALMLPTLLIAGDGSVHALSDTVSRLAQEFHISLDELGEKTPSGTDRQFNNRVRWAVHYLKRGGLIAPVGLGQFRITDRGREVLAKPPSRLDSAFLKRLHPDGFKNKARTKRAISREEGAATFKTTEGRWELRPGVEERISQVMERNVSDESGRRAALEFLAFAIENADAERSDAWYLRETERGLRLMTGRLIACDITRSRMGVSVMGPVSDEVREALEADSEGASDYWKMVPGGLWLRVPIHNARDAIDLLRDGFDRFVDEAMARVRRSVSLEDHVPEAVAYVERIVGRSLPQPRPNNELEDADDDSTEENDEASREPQVRGRAPIFEHGQRSIASLVSDIEREVIALPDLQRPFVWEDTKVRDLLDSLFLGFPVGTLVLWHTSTDKEARGFGTDRPGLRSTTLVIDGQQRLTSLYAVMRGVDVYSKDGSKRRVTIAFRPRDGRFEVADAAIRKDPEFLPNVTELWNGSRPKPQIRRDLINALRDRGRVVSEAYEDAVERNLDRAHAISDYRLPTVDIRKTSTMAGEETTEEDVAEIFVRINNQGTRLGQADFVLTLLSVFHGTLRDRIEIRAREMSVESAVGIDTQQLLRAACAVAFGRARMSAVYRSLRGIDPTTGTEDPEARAKNLGKLDQAASECMRPTPWRDYLLRVRHAGFVNQSLIASKSAIINAFAIYIRGRQSAVPKARLDEVISRWVFCSLLTARYSGSSESMFEADLARISRSEEAETFISNLDDAIEEVITRDFWTQTLVSLLETQKSRSPAALAFRAAQVVLGARALFSDQLLQNLLDPPAQGKRAASETHHLFPVAWLESQGIIERRRLNQVANLADVGWHENVIIGAKAPSEYLSRIRLRLGIEDDRWGRMCAEHALPVGWELMKYDEFLSERRQRMADIIRVAFRKLGGESDAQAITPPWFLPGAESVWLRIVETERGLRRLVREVYAEAFGEGAANAIETTLSEAERHSLSRSLRARPEGSDPLSIVDYLYLGQLLPRLFVGKAWHTTQVRLSGARDLKQRLQAAMNQIVPVRNEIAHVREVNPERLLRASAACSEVLEVIKAKAPDQRVS